MSSFAISLVVFACVFGGAVLGMFLRSILPQHHLSSDSQGVVNLGMGLVATISALVLGLLVSSAKNFYDTQNAELTGMSSRIIILDRVLAAYGPETKEARDVLSGVVVRTIDRMWPQERTGAPEVDRPPGGADVVYDTIQALSPKDDRQRSLQAQALNVTMGLGQTRWLMYEQGATSFSKPLLVILIFWITTIFISFGLFAPRNATVTAALFVSGLSVSGAIFLILEMYAPYSGLIEVSSAPLRLALAHLGQ
jgi:hypothetical protein